MDSKLSNWCEGLIEAGWLAAVVATPLFFNIHSSRVFEPDKLTLMRSIAVIMAAAWLIRFIDGQGWRSLDWLRWRSSNSIWRMPLVLPAFLLAVAYLVSTIFSITFNVSWAGSYQRLQGTYSTLSYLVIFVLMAATIRRRGQVSRIVTTIIVTSIPVALYGMLQHFGLDPLPWGGDVQERVAGHMGNSIFIAAYLIMVVPLTLARIIDAFTNILQDEEIETADVIRSSIYIFALAIQIIAIYWSRSRGPFLGLAVSMYAFVLILLVTLRNTQSSEQRRLSIADMGRAILLVGLGIILPLLLVVVVLGGRVSASMSLAVFAGTVSMLVIVILVMALAKRGWRWLWLSWIFLAVLLAGVLGLFNVGSETAENYAHTPVFGDTLQTMSSWRELPEIGRFGRLLESEGGSGRVRVLIWDGVLELIAPHDPLDLPDGQADPFNVIRPVVGYGPESMYVVYNRFYQPELATIEARNASPDRAHNETFDALVITGVTGFLIWQFLYLSVFYYGFRWLGVVKSSRDRNWLILLWIGGAIVGGGVLTALLGMSFLGVAIPFGTIAGLVVYLIYYALTSRPDNSDKEINPFGIDRLLMIGLIAAVLAHYVEIHFGIAIAATRTYFFVYAALLFLVGYYLPRIKVEMATGQTGNSLKRTKRRRTGVSNRTPGWGSSALTYALILALIVGILAFNFLTFSLPPGEVIQSAEQVPGPGQIIYQSLFINAGLGFVESPFLFILLIMSWLLGSLVMVSEMAKLGQIGLLNFASRLVPQRQRFAVFLLISLALVPVVVALIPRLAADVQGTSPFSRIGFWLAAIWASICLWGVIRLSQQVSTARQYVGMIGLAGIVLSLPLLVAGESLLAILLAALGAGLLYLLWDKDWQNLITPIAVVFLVSISVGLLFAYLHALQLRSGILPPPGVTETTAATVRRVLETDQAASLLTTFYIYVFVILALTALALAWSKFSSSNNWASLPGAVGFIILFPLAIYFISTSNLRVIQADIVYKRADPWDKQAAQTGDPSIWDNAIAIYEHAIDLAPLEDFYYLWLGRAYLERSTVTGDPVEQENLLRVAEDRLKQAQAINPLNTDHTANLARLNTRWAEIADGEQRAERARIATEYYETALSLSPNNSVIRNEYARLAFILEQDCERALTLYDESIKRDPYNTASYFDRAEVNKACAALQAPEDQDDYYARAAESMVDALNRNSGSPRHWLQLAEIYIRLGRRDDANSAYEDAIKRAGDDMPPWQIDYTMAQWYFEEDDLNNAEIFGEKALEMAPPDAVPIIQQFLSLVESGATETEG